MYACRRETDVSGQYLSVFGSGLGVFVGATYLPLDLSVRPILLQAKSSTFALSHKFSAEMNPSTKTGAISNVDGLTGCISKFTIVTKKTGELHVCVDPKPLNGAPSEEYYVLLHWIRTSPSS